jgi:hypothetical protein
VIDNRGDVGVTLALQEIDAVEADDGVGAGVRYARLQALAARARGEHGLAEG